MHVNPILCILHPRRIPEVVECFNSITKYDKLYISYYKSHKAHIIARKFVKKNKEYTHGVLIADDIVFPNWYVDKMIKTLEDHPEYEVLGCPCNYDSSKEGKKLYAVCMFDIPAKAKSERKYNWLPIEYAPKEGIHSVAHQGAALFFISRRLLDEEILTLQTDLAAEITLQANPGIDKGQQCCPDIVMSHQLSESGIKSYVDFSLPIKHLKAPRGISQGLLVGKREPEIEFVKRNI